MTKNLRASTLARDTGLFAISSFGSKVLIFLLTPLYTSILTTEEYGIADLITVTINFVYPVLTLAIADATLRYSLDEENDKSKVLCNSLLLTFISIVCLFPFYGFVKWVIPDIAHYWIIFVVTFGLFNIHNCLSSFLKGIGKTALFAVQGVIQTISIIVCNVLLLIVFKMGLYGYLISIIVGYSVPIVLMLIAGKLKNYLFPVRLDSKLLKDMIKYSLPMVPTLLAWAINTSADKYMIIGLVGLGASGIYGVAHKIPTIFTAIMSIFTQAWQISAISNYGTEDESEFHTAVYKGLDIISVICCMAIIIICKPLASFLFAKDFYVAWQYVPLLTVAAMFASHGGFLASTFRAAKKTNSLFVSVIIGSFINIILNWILINILGTIGAALATALCFIVIWISRLIMVQKIVAIKIDVVRTIATYTFYMIAVALMTLNIHNAGIFCCICLIIICCINYVTIVSTIKSLVLTLNYHRLRK